MAFLSSKRSKTAIAVCLFLFCIGLAPANAKVVINEIMWPGTDLSSSDEWVELLGTGSGAVSETPLSGWTLSTLNSAGNETPMYHFGPSQTIGSGQLLVISHFDAAHSRLLADPFATKEDMSLPNTKLQLRLRNASGVLMDEADDGVGNPAAGNNPKAPAWKASMERISPSFPGPAASSWRTAFTFIGFDDGAALFGTPGFPNGSGPSKDISPPFEAQSLTSIWEAAQSGMILRVNWLPSTSLDLSGQTLEIFLNDQGSNVTFSESLPRTASGKIVQKISADFSYRVRVRSIDSSGNVSSGSQISVQPYLKINSSLSSFSSSVSSMDSVLHQENISNTGSVIGSLSSSSASNSSMTSSASGTSMPIISSGILLSTVRISEILSHPAEGSAAEWVELENISAQPVNIAGWLLQNQNKDKYNIPALNSSGFVLLPQQYVSLHSLKSLSLSDNGGTLTLNQSGHTIDSLLFPALPIGVSYGRDASSLGSLRPYCIPTDSQPNDDTSWDADLQLQSGTTTGEESTTVNVQVIPRTGSFEQVKCVIDFGDKSFASVCNPPSHTYGTVGTYTLKAEITNYCGTTILRSMPIHVLEKAVTFSTASAASVAPAAVHVDPTQGIESFSLAQSSRSGSLVGAVIKVIDGDTFDVLLGSGADSFVQRRVRFASINAPELKGKTDQEIFYAKKAKEFLTGLILNKKIELQFDSKLKKYDRYGRLLAHVYSSRQDPIEDAMLQSGMAKVFTTASDQNSHYLALQSQAQTEKKGMWSDTYLVGGQPIDASGALESFIPAEDTQDSFITEAAALQTLSRSSKSKSSSSHAASSKAKKTVAKKVGIKKVSAKKSSSSKSPSAVVACMSGSMLSAELGDVSGSGSTPLILLIPLSAIVGWLLGMFFKRVKSG